MRDSVSARAPKPEDQPVKRGGPSCLVAGLLILLAPYLLNLFVVFTPALANWVKWKQRGWSDYTIRLRNTSFGPLAGESTIRVASGEVESVVHLGISVDRLDSWSDYTVEGMFRSLGRCVVIFPIVSCSIRYDAEYGFPRKLLVNCPIPDACFEEISVLDVHPSE